MDDIRPFSTAMTRSIMTPSRLYFRPRFIGLDQLDPGKPALFVGNHRVYGMLDLSLMAHRHGPLPRALGHHPFINRVRQSDPAPARLIRRAHP